MNVARLVSIRRDARAHTATVTRLIVHVTEITQRQHVREPRGEPFDAEQQRLDPPVPAGAMALASPLLRPPAGGDESIDFARKIARLGIGQQPHVLGNLGELEMRRARIAPVQHDQIDDRLPFRSLDVAHAVVSTLSDSSSSHSRMLIGGGMAALFSRVVDELQTLE